MNFRKLTPLVFIASLAGCSSLPSLNPFSGSAPTAQPTALVDFTPSLPVRSAWSTNIGRAENFSFTPIYADRNIYAASSDGVLARIDAESGQLVWRVNTETPLTAGVGADGHTIAVAGEKGTVLAYGTDGKLRWKIQTSSEILSVPAVGQGLIIVRSVDNQIVAFDAESGFKRWSVPRPAPALTLRSAPGILISGPNVYVGLPGGRLLALSAINGTPRWEAVVADPRGTTEIERIADISGMPALVGRIICAVTYQGRVGCYDAINGGQRWNKNISSNIGLGADERFVYVADEKGVMNTFTLENGQSVWRNEKLINRQLSAPISVGRAVAVGDGQGYIHFLSREDGTFLARIGTDGSQIIGTPQIVGQNFIYQTQNGNVGALKIE